MAYSPQLYAQLKYKDLERRLENLTPIIQSYVHQYEQIATAMRNIEAGEELLRKLRERIEWCKKEMSSMIDKWSDTASIAEIEKAMLHYKPIIYASYRDYYNIKRAMEDFVDGGGLLAEIREKLEDLNQEITNIQIVMELKS